MDINLSITCNRLNLKAVAKYLERPEEELLGLYEELQADESFLAELNQQFTVVKQTWGFNKGIFGKDQLPSVDWFAFERILLYVLIRLLKPAQVLETGVYYGGNTSFLLHAVRKNQSGRVISIDLPDSQIRASLDTSWRHPLVGDSELYQENLAPGFLVPDSLKPFWNFIQGSSLDEIPKLSGEFAFYIHDSDHAFGFLSKELGLAWKLLTPNAVVVVDDIDWSNAFMSFCSVNQLYPLLLTDNGKDDLRVRTGLIRLSHPFNSTQHITR